MEVFDPAKMPKNQPKRRISYEHFAEFYFLSSHLWGDTVVIESLSRLGRSTKDMIELTELFHSRGVNLVSLKEAIDTNTSTGKLLFTLMSAIVQFERDCIADRTREGLKSARARGKVGGRPKMNPDNVKKAIKLYGTGQYCIKEIEELTGVKKSTLYRNVQEVAAAK